MFRLARIAGKGRGLLASEAIAAGSVIERAPVVRLADADRAVVDRTALFAYTFVDPEAFGPDTPGEGHDCLLAFGNLTFCNHSAQPNATVRWMSDDVGWWASLEALRSIAADEEITLYYTNISEYSAGDLFI
jgi:SET domain